MPASQSPAALSMGNMPEASPTPSTFAAGELPVHIARQGGQVGHLVLHVGFAPFSMAW